jgi:hypothetical protein
MEVALYIFVSFFLSMLKGIFIKIIISYILIISQIKNNHDLFLIFISCFMTGAISLGKLCACPSD